MLLDRSQQELAAVRRLGANGDFSTFLEWVGRSLAETHRVLADCDDATRLRWLQGQAQALRDLLTSIESTRAVMERQR